MRSYKQASLKTSLPGGAPGGPRECQGKGQRPSGLRIAREEPCVAILVTLGLLALLWVLPWTTVHVLPTGKLVVRLVIRLSRKEPPMDSTLSNANIPRFQLI